MERFGGTGAVALLDLPDPEPGPGEVVVAVRAAALNHLDLWTVKGAIASPELPHVLGADGAGVIAAVGEGVRGLEPGLPVIVNPAISCGECERCRAGEQSECTTFRMIGEHLLGPSPSSSVSTHERLPVPRPPLFRGSGALGVTFITATDAVQPRGLMPVSGCSSPASAGALLSRCSSSVALWPAGSS